MMATRKIKDLGLAAAIVTIDVEISDTEKDETGRTYFIFSYEDSLGANIDTAVDNYWSGHLSVDARRYFENIKMLKSRIYNER